MSLQFRCCPCFFYPDIIIDWKIDMTAFSERHATLTGMTTI